MNRIKSTTSDIIYSSIIVFILTSAGQLLGFFREAIFGKYFGTTRSFDAFTLIFSIILFASSLLNVVPFFLIPVLAGAYSRKDRAEFTRQLLQIVIMVFFIVAMFVLIGEVFADRIVALFGVGLINDKNVFNFSIFLMRFSIPILFLLTLSQILRSLLNLQNLFVVPAMESLIFNIGIITSITLSWNYFNIKSPISIVLGYYLAYTVFIFLCFFLLTRLEELSFWKIIDFKTVMDFKTIKGLTNDLLFLLVATCLNYLNPLVLVRYASYLSEGAVSSLGYVQRIMSFSIGNIVGSVLVIFLPTASIYFAKKENTHLREDTEKIMKIFLTISIFAVGFIFLNNEILVRLIYHRGVFDEHSVRLVSGLLYYYLPWIIFFPLSNISTRILYVTRNYKHLALISAAGLLFTLSVVPTLQKNLELNGLGLMSSLHMAFYSIMLIGYIRAKHFRLNVFSILKNGILDVFWAGLIVSALLVLKSSASINNYIFLMLSTLFLCFTCLWRINKNM